MPGRTRSLPNRNLNLRHKYFVVEPPRDLGRLRSLKKQGERLDQIRSRLFDGRALARDIELRAQGDKPVVLSLNDGGQALAASQDSSLQPFMIRVYDGTRCSAGRA